MRRRERFSISPTVVTSLNRASRDPGLSNVTRKRSHARFSESANSVRTRTASTSTASKPRR
jgi:hypothetical protein